MTGMPFWDAYKPHLYNANRRARQKQKRTENPVSQRYAIRARWGMEWYELLALLHAQGLNRGDCARAMGYASRMSLYSLLQRHPDKDPWDIRTIPMQYLADTGETFPDAVRRMAAEGLNLGEALVLIGYAPGAHTAMRQAMEAWGVEDTFIRRRAGYRPISDNWARRLELAAGAPRIERKAAEPAPVRKTPSVHPWRTAAKRDLAKLGIS